MKNPHFFRALAIAGLSYVPWYTKLLFHRESVAGQEERGLKIWLSSHARALRLSPQLEVQNVVELGPGSSFGAGIWALLLGCRTYTAIETLQLTDYEKNAQVLSAIVDRVRAGDFAAMCGEFGWDVETVRAQVSANAPMVADELRALYAGGESSRLRCVTPEDVGREIPDAGVDMVFSNVVFEHVDDMEGLVRTIHRILRPGGASIHVADLRSHMTHSLWNGHWTYSEHVWRLLRGNRPYLINRLPASAYERLFGAQGFAVNEFLYSKRKNTLRPQDLAPPFTGLRESDLQVAGLTCLSVK